MKKNFIYGTLLAVVAGATLTLASCSKDDDGNGGKIVVSIPSDSEATANPTLPEEANTTIPNLNYTVETENGHQGIHSQGTIRRGKPPIHPRRPLHS